MMNLNQLRAFFLTAKHLNYTRASRELFITQPAVTAQVKLLEESIDIKLFKKSKGKLFLTDAGKTIYEYAKIIFQSEGDLEVAINELKRLGKGTLHLGTARTYSKYFIPLLISRFHETYPQIRIELNEGNSSAMIQSLRTLQNEIVITARKDDAKGISFIPFVREEVLLIFPSNHLLSKKRKILLHDIADEPIIMKEIGSGTRRLVDEMFTKGGITPRILMETSDAEIIKLLVRHGEGVSFLVKTAVERELREDLLKSGTVSESPLFIEIGIAYLSNQPLSSAAHAFLNSLESIGIDRKRFQDMNILMDKIRNQVESSSLS
ncbi:MAG: LysR family transcriptional regulator [Thermodesulfobacteriota bacterium]